MKISNFIKKLEEYKNKHGDLDIEMYERVVDCNNQNYTNPKISFYKSWKEIKLYSKEEIEKMSRRKMIKKAKEHYGEDLVRKGISDEELIEMLIDVIEEIEVLALGIDGDDKN